MYTQESSAQNERPPRTISLIDLTRQVGVGQSRLQKILNLRNIHGATFDIDTLLHQLRNTPDVSMGKERIKNIHAKDKILNMLGQENLPLEIKDTDEIEVQMEDAGMPVDSAISTMNTIDLEQPMFSDEEFAERRRALEETFKDIADVRTKYNNGEISPEELVRTLGNITFDLTPEDTKLAFHLDQIAGHDRRVEITAFDTLMRAIGDEGSADTATQDKIMGELIMQIADTEIPSKRTYLLGLLAHFGSQNRFEREFASEDPNFSSTAEIESARQTVVRLKSSAARLAQVFGNNSPYTKYCNLVVEDFPNPKIDGDDMSEEQAELEQALLIAELYDGPESLTEVDLSERNLWDEHDGGGSKRGLLTDNPGLNVILPAHAHPSIEKIKEAERFGWALGPVATTIKDNEKMAPVLFPLSRERNNLYALAIREAKDKGDREALANLRTVLHQEVWDSLDSTAQMQIGGPDRMTVRFTTIRDNPPEAVLTPPIEQT